VTEFDDSLTNVRLLQIYSPGMFQCPSKPDKRRLREAKQWADLPWASVSYRWSNRQLCSRMGRAANGTDVR